jgi:hypothetical protein
MADSAVQWAYNPWRERRGWQHPAVALALLLAIAALAGWAFSHPAWWPGMLPWSLMAITVLLAMTASLFLPVRYRLDDQGVTVHFLGAPSFRPWEHYRNYYIHDTGVHLTTMPQPSALDPFRGHLLLYGGGNKGAVVQIVKAHIVRAEQTATEAAPVESDN